MFRTRFSIPSVIVLLSLLAAGCSESEDVTSVRLNESALTLKVGENATLVAIVEPPVADKEAVCWKSSDPSVATVSDGRIVVLKEGTASITASVGGVVSRVCLVTVEMGEIQKVPDEVADAITDAAEADAAEAETAESDDAAGEETADDADGAVPEDADDDSASDDDTGAADADETAVTVGVSDPAEDSADADDEAAGLRYCFVYEVDFGSEGSYIDIDSLVTVSDWRGRNFNDYPNYWDYYGPFEITIDIENAQWGTDESRVDLPESVLLFQTEAGKTSVEDPTSGAEVTLPENRHGFLMCRFSSVVLSSRINIYVKAKVKSGFGYLQTDWITIPVVNTVEKD